MEREVVAAAEREFVQNGAIMAVESLDGRELQWFFRNINDGVEHLSPSPRIFVTQIGLEPVLRERAAALGGRLRYSAELVSLSTDDDGVTARVRDRRSGEESTVRARYAVAADGVRSPLRHRLGIGMRGHGTFSDSVTIYFRGDVRPLLGDRNLSVVYVVNPRLQGFFRFAIDGRSGFLVVNTAVDDDGRRTTVGGTATEADCVRYVRDALGAPDLAVEIDDVQRWNASAEWAERFAAGRVLLAVTRLDPGLGTDGLMPMVDDALIDLGHRYRSAAITPDGSDDGDWEDPREPTGRPGFRLPHVPVRRAGTELSTLDLVSTAPVLFTGSGGAAWARAGETAAARLGVPLDVYGVGPGGDVEDPDRAFASAGGIGAEGAMLVRPDGFVAWRAAEAVVDPVGVLYAALARSLVRRHSSG
ncbi:FAD-dependent monooxygenase [Virgisporangium aurantiacum]|uniref:FAD-dependent oxidoreductase n=1 Tax=Virgisporangium aurantiacum TaxID=175570 RepID=A0A8J4E1A9_9ACTN|nr:FAD-dependent monooxygenase [Virgisporangium aurantiacum]GIJ57568.1 FAD-dependent oxidoreductase [Virgisporangium aurantiacum]